MCRALMALAALAAGSRPALIDPAADAMLLEPRGRPPLRHLILNFIFANSRALIQPLT